MITDRKKQLEILTADFFRGICPEFPKGRLVPSESPDFILSLGIRNSVGIEITRLYPAGPQNSHFSDDRRMIESVFVDRVRELFGNYSGDPVWVKFLFSNDRAPHDAEILLGSARVSAGLKKNLRNLSAKNLYLLIPPDDLPSFLDAVLLIKHPVLHESIWESCDLPGCDNDLVADVNHVIERKEEKLPLYQAGNHSQYWLLIVADRLSAFRKRNTGNIIMNHIFSSAFQRVYLIEMMNMRYFQLI